MSLIDTQQLNANITKTLQESIAFHKELADVKNQLEDAIEHKSEYVKLVEISDQLQELHESGAGKLFWGEMFETEEEMLAHIEELRTKADNFYKSIETLTEIKAELEQKIIKTERRTALFKGDMQYRKERKEDLKNEFVVHRKMGPIVYRPILMPWTSKKEDEKRYRRYMLLAVLYSILSALVIPRIIIPVPDVPEEVKVPERLTKFIKRELKKEEPKPEPKPQVETKVASKKKPTKTEVKAARKKASTSGLLAFKNNFADLMDEASEAKLGANAKLSKQGSKAKASSRSIITNQAKSGSGGINVASLSREVGGAGGKIGAVKFSRVTSEIGTAIDDRPLSDAPGPSRTDEEIQIVFDRYKAALYRIYNRELRNNPTLQGKMVLRITILPDGKVSACKVESTDLESDVLSEKIVKRVKRFNFGAKEGVPKITILYPIDFLPAS